MPNNTETYWSVGAESLHTYARSIQTLSGLRAAPEMRGDDITIPYRPGDVWVQKEVSSRQLTLAMTVLGVADGPGATALTKQAFDLNWDNLVRILFRPNEQFPLTKRFYGAGGTLRSATALVEFKSGFDAQMLGRKKGKTSVDIKLADPYFYDDVVQTFTLVNGDNTINVQGNAPTRKILVTVNGSRTNAKLQVKAAAPRPTHEVSHSGVLLTGDSLAIDIPNFSAIVDPNTGANFDATLDIRNAGAPYWMQLYPGDNIVNLSSASGLGTVQLQVQGAWV